MALRQEAFETQLTCRYYDALAEVLRDVSTLIDHPVHCGRANSGSASNVRQCRPLAFLHGNDLPFSRRIASVLMEINQPVAFFGSQNLRMSRSA
jgi:hypothetical protein